jgi:hypothetical protein
MNFHTRSGHPADPYSHRVVPSVPGPISAPTSGAHRWGEFLGPIAVGAHREHAGRRVRHRVGVRIDERAELVALDVAERDALWQVLGEYHGAQRQQGRNVADVYVEVDPVLDDLGLPLRTHDQVPMALRLAERSLPEPRHRGRVPFVDDHRAEVFRHRMKLTRPPRCGPVGQRSNTSRVLVAVATTAPSGSVTMASAKPTRDPDLTTVPVAVSNPLVTRTALR